MDEWDALGHGMKIDRRATDWGLASLGVTGAFLIMAPIMLIFNDFYWSIGIHHADRQEIASVRVACPIVGLAFLGLICFGIFCGFRGIGVARTSQHAVALPLAGVVVGFVDFFIWLAMGINLMAIIGLIQI